MRGDEEAVDGVGGDFFCFGGDQLVFFFVVINLSQNLIQNIQVQGVLHPLCQCAWWTGGSSSEGWKGGAEVDGSQVQGNQGQALLREACCKAGLLLVKRINHKTNTAVQLKCSETTIWPLLHGNSCSGSLEIQRRTTSHPAHDEIRLHFTSQCALNIYVL